MDETSKHAVAIEFVEALKEKLTPEHGKFTGALKSSINYKLVDDGIVISMEDYGEYLEFGTPNPTTPDEIMHWVEVKIMPNIKTKGKDKYKQKRQIAESIAAHITKYGPRPLPFIRETLNNDLPKIIKKYS